MIEALTRPWTMALEATGLDTARLPSAEDLPDAPDLGSLVPDLPEAPDTSDGWLGRALGLEGARDAIGAFVAVVAVVVVVAILVVGAVALGALRAPRGSAAQTYAGGFAAALRNGIGGLVTIQVRAVEVIGDVARAVIPWGR